MVKRAPHARPKLLPILCSRALAPAFATALSISAYAAILAFFPDAAPDAVAPDQRATGEGITNATLRATLLTCSVIAIIASLAWLGVRLIDGVERHILAAHRTDVRDNLIARRVHTQTRVIARTLDTMIVLIAGAAILYQFEPVRNLGTALLASAGIAGLVLGMAARPVFANILAGLQIALTQPINLDDVVIVENEWGWIERITSTYVVVKIWDQRRLVVPLSHFIEKPFQNWTKENSELLGTVFLHADYTVPIDELRAELRRLLESSELWDGRVGIIQVTSATDRTLELRALMSAIDSPKLWDLRCMVREGLVRYLQENYPAALPRVRASVLDSGDDPTRWPAPRSSAPDPLPHPHDAPDETTQPDTPGGLSEGDLLPDNPSELVSEHDPTDAQAASNDTPRHA